MIAKYVKGFANLQKEIVILDAAKKNFVIVANVTVNQEPENERIYVIYICDKN